jgi:cytochrome c biogenesis factor
MVASLPGPETMDALAFALARAGGPVAVAVCFSVVALLVACFVPAAARLRRPALIAVTASLAIGEAVLAWFHWRLYEIAVVADPATGAVTGSVAVPLWVESEKLYVWALLLAVMLLAARTHAGDLLPGGAVMLAMLVAGAFLSGRPFAEPLPDFLAQYRGYLQAMSLGGGTAAGAFQGMEGSRQFYYNTWYMWVHPPLLFLSYGAFVMSFIAAALAAWRRRSSYETTAYRWARFGYLPLTAGMLLGFPWAILAWSGESWWWSGKVNMSIMMWLLYTAYLHLRLHLRRRGMWRWVLALAFVSFSALVLTYVTTYVVPGAHSVAG